MNKPYKSPNDEAQDRAAKTPGNGASRLSIPTPETNGGDSPSRIEPLIMQPPFSELDPQASSVTTRLVETGVEAPAVLKLTPPDKKHGGNGDELPSNWGLAGSKQFRSPANFPLVSDRTDAVATEAFSVLRSRLLSVQKKIGMKSVIITSAEGGDGKSVVSTNLALSLGQLGTKRILLIDGDLRTGTTTKVLKLEHLTGLGDFLQGTAPFDAVITPTELPALFVAPAGGVVMKKALSEILQGPRWTEFMQQARQQFDMIVVDSLPFSAPVADLELMSAICDAALLVVCIRRTKQAAVKRAAARLDPKKFLGVIINNAAEIYDYDYGYLSVKRSK